MGRKILGRYTMNLLLLLVCSDFAFGWLVVYSPLVLRGTEFGSIVCELVKPTTARKTERETTERMVECPKAVEKRPEM